MGKTGLNRVCAKGVTGIYKDKRLVDARFNSASSHYFKKGNRAKGVMISNGIK